MSSRLFQVIQQIDEVNSQDPKQYELNYSKQLTEWVSKLDSEPSEYLQIAARGQHIARWMIPRNQYDMNRVGYLLWREERKKFHASKVSEFMKKAGYSAEEILKTTSIILKKNLKQDPDVQTLEDALCLLFLETQFDDLRQKTEIEKMKEVVRKTWKKMSLRGQQQAFNLPLSAENRRFLNEALSSH